MAKRRGKGEGGTVVIKREEIIAGGHHGGAWKVAYADFVTAMMAFFLLMWLLNATTEQQRRGIAAYFSPMANVENGFSGTGLVPGAVTPLDKGSELVIKTTTSPVALVVPASAKPSPPDINSGGSGDADEPPQPKSSTPAILDGGDAAPAPPGPSVNFSGQDGSSPPVATRPDVAPAPPGTAAAAAKTGDAGEAAAQEQRSLTAAAGALKQLVASDPALAASAGQMAIDVTPEGLRIQIMDRDSQPMFQRGATALNDRASALLRKVAPFLAGLPEPVSIGGYTDGAAWPAGSLSNWSLSAGRANAARDVLVASGLPDKRITDVSGYADRHLLLPAQPMADANRRVVLTLRRLRPAPPSASAPISAPAADQPAGG